ncbi:hypothetical protein SAMD00079811_83090 (plasmid) [Scytonema sp. HK-05]|uniref:hypothetical protein n=1 Tax=Scytonema sp. HK-05 TaxID=1137095 RepID=UPI0009367D30|nr:hypothetical protein [Scytonema sp. HK-05]OKH44702.1 hypothetical protein NIES2130_37730 [Scytonema sp. HK-05]BAY50678.1 hypothetical protein SAMD00079811_83090 [Scytonema sp. HK-05]
MLDLQELTTSAQYLIAGRQGFWHYSGESREKLRFWRWAMGETNRRISLALTKEQAEKKVWKQVDRLDLSNLEAFRNE